MWLRQRRHHQVVYSYLPTYVNTFLTFLLACSLPLATETDRNRIIGQGEGRVNLERSSGAKFNSDINFSHSFLMLSLSFSRYWQTFVESKLERKRKGLYY